MSPEYVSAFEAALLANSSAQGIQIPFTTYYTYQTSITGEASQDTTFWIRKPVRYLKAVYWGAIQEDKDHNGHEDSYRFSRVTTDHTGITAAPSLAPGTESDALVIESHQISIGTKTYREIDDAAHQKPEKIHEINCNESDVFFAKAVGHYNDYSTETSELNGQQKVYANQTQGIDLEFSPDNDVLASETTLNSNDIRMRLKSGGKGLKGSTQKNYNIYTFVQYQASVALFPGNETRLLVT